MTNRSKLPTVGTSIFTVMSQMARDHGALDFSQGFPDFPVDEGLVSRVTHYMNKGFNQYAPSPGIPELRKAISKSFSVYGNVDPECVTITEGATEALSSTILALIETGDEVIVFDPAYDAYDPLIRLSGGVPIHLKLNDDFSIDWDLVSRGVTPKTKMIIINSPHNPSGSILGREDLLSLQNLAVTHDLLVLSDEVYHHIVFDGQKHESVLAYPELANRSIATFSFGKIFHVTGWKIGFTVAPVHLTKEIRKVHQFLTFSIHTPTQYAFADELAETDFEALSGFFQKKRDLFLNSLDAQIFEVQKSAGTYFQLLRYNLNFTDIDLSEKLIKEFKIGSVPISVFYEDGTDPGQLRFCLAKADNSLEKGASILNNLRL